MRHPPPLSHCLSVVDYGFPWDQLLSSFKFHHQLGLKRLLADLMEHAITQAARPAPDWVLPVPLHEDRLRERGYNQSWELARMLARRRQWPHDAGLLQRIRATPHQVGLSQKDRSRNLKHAFVVTPALRPRIEGCRIALVDDVMTTGATLHEAANTLLTAGASAVEAWVFARTPESDFS